MTSTELVQSEIRRFLCSPEQEVLCITGDWGVGKTYTWQKALDETKASKLDFGQF
jgi:type II secretory pathway predicted ATPase ExeA